MAVTEGLIAVPEKLQQQNTVVPPLNMFQQELRSAGHPGEAPGHVGQLANAASPCIRSSSRTHGAMMPLSQK